MQYTQILETDFTTPHPNPNHVPGVTYDPTRRMVTTGIQSGTIGCFIVTDGSRICILTPQRLYAQLRIEATSQIEEATGCIVEFHADSVTIKGEFLTEGLRLILAKREELDTFYQKYMVKL